MLQLRHWVSPTWNQWAVNKTQLHKNVYTLCSSQKLNSSPFPSAFKLYTCIGYFLNDVTWQESSYKMKGLFWLTFEGETVHHSEKVAGHITSSVRRQRVDSDSQLSNLKVYSQWLGFSSKVLPPNCATAFQNNTPSLEQVLKPMSLLRSSLHSYHNNIPSITSSNSSVPLILEDPNRWIDSSTQMIYCLSLRGFEAGL